MRPEDLLRKASGHGKKLVECSACGGQMAKGARACPHCGKTYTTAGGVFVAVVVGLVLAGWFFRR